jgi:predicted nucleic acid-binding Zn ribbon protein
LLPLRARVLSLVRVWCSTVRRDSNRPGRLAETLGRVVQRIDPDQRLEVYRVWTFWADEVGASIAARAEPLRFRAGVLFVRVASHAWMQELQFMKETLRERLNSRLGSPLIRDVYFVSAPEVEARPAAKEAEPPAPPEPVVPLPPIGDPRLADAFQRIARAHARRHAGRGTGAARKN